MQALVDPAPPLAGERPVEVGVVLDALSEDGQALRFRIESVALDPKDAEREVMLYEVSVQHSGSSAWRPYCQPDREGFAGAIPLDGSWNQRLGWSPADGAITFACTKGAIAKCVRWGYKPWKAIDGRSLRDHHSACMRMARADYCGDGVAHTRDGTRINIYDPLGVQKHDADEPGNPGTIEAGWSPAGATYLYRPRLTDTSDEIVAQCPQRLGPRTARAGDAPLTAAAILARWPETLIFNDRYAIRH